MELAEKQKYSTAKNGSTISPGEKTLLTMLSVNKDLRKVGELYIGISLLELHKNVSSIKTAIAIFCLLIVLIGISAAVGISKIVTAPIKKMAGTFAEITNGNLSKRAEVTTKDEVGQLADSFNIMVNHLESAYKELENSNKILHQEINERKKAEEELRKISQAVIQSPVSIIISDKEGKIEYTNPKFLQISGYSLDEVIGHNPRSLLTPEPRENISAEIMNTISSGKIWKGELQTERRMVIPIGDFHQFHQLQIRKGTLLILLLCRKI